MQRPSCVVCLRNILQPRLLRSLRAALISFTRAQLPSYLGCSGGKIDLRDRLTHEEEEEEECRAGGRWRFFARAIPAAAAFNAACDTSAAR
jgi:hypothetical protein